MNKEDLILEQISLLRAEVSSLRGCVVSLKVDVGQMKERSSWRTKGLVGLSGLLPALGVAIWVALK